VDLAGEEYFCEGVDVFNLDAPLSCTGRLPPSLTFLSGVVEYTFLVVPSLCPVEGRVSLVLGLLYSCLEGVVR
jgi:hypothetical protein